MRQSHRKVVTGRRVANAIKSLVNARGLQLECAKVLHEMLLVPVLMYGLMGIRRMDKVLNGFIRELCGVIKVLFGDLTMWKKYRMISKRVYMGGVCR